MKLCKFKVNDKNIKMKKRNNKIYKIIIICIMFMYGEV